MLKRTRSIARRLTGATSKKSRAVVQAAIPEPTPDPPEIAAREDGLIRAWDERMALFGVSEAEKARLRPLAVAQIKAQHDQLRAEYRARTQQR